MHTYEVYKSGYSIDLIWCEVDIAVAAGMIRPCGREETGDYTLTDDATWDGLHALLDGSR